MANYEKFAIKTMDIAQERGVDLTDPDAVEPIAREVANEYVLDEDKLIQLIRQRVDETRQIGNIYEDDPDEKVASTLLERAREWAEQNDVSAQEVDWSDFSYEEQDEKDDLSVQEIDSSDHPFRQWRRDTDSDDRTEPDSRQ